MGSEVEVTRLSPAHDPDAFARALEVLGQGLVRYALRVHAAEATAQTTPADQAEQFR